MAQWKPGQSGNPNGRPISSEAEKLRKAMRRVEKERGESFYIKFCQMAFEDSTVMIALAKKLIPDLKQVEQNIDLQGQYGVIAFPTKLPVGAPCVDGELDLAEIK